MQIRMHKRQLDGKVEVWAEMEVTWGGDFYPELGFKTTEPVLVEVLSPGQRSVFFNERRDSAPLWAGDGFGASKVS